MRPDLIIPTPLRKSAADESAFALGAQPLTRRSQSHLTYAGYGGAAQETSRIPRPESVLDFVFCLCMSFTWPSLSVIESPDVSSLSRRQGPPSVDVNTRGQYFCNSFHASSCKPHARVRPHCPHPQNEWVEASTDEPVVTVRLCRAAPPALHNSEHCATLRGRGLE